MKAGRRPKQKEKSGVQYVVVASFSRAATNLTRRPPHIRRNGNTLINLTGRITLRREQCYMISKSKNIEIRNVV
jgi:hypothetical protein